LVDNLPLRLSSSEFRSSSSSGSSPENCVFMTSSAFSSAPFDYSSSERMTKPFLFFFLCFTVT
jgi:hypothetical protein